jgi:alanine racemase
VRPAWMEIDLDAYRRNLEEVRRKVGGRRVMAVVKANGYGHGMAPVARAAVAAGVEMLGVALVEEGVALRHAAIGAPVLVLAPCLPEQAAAVVAHGLEQVVTDHGAAEALSRAATARGRETPVHVKVDTGMGRVGVAPETAVAFCREVAALPGLRVAGVMTHFAGADDPDLAPAHAQLACFQEIVPAVRRALPDTPLFFHAANSAAIAFLPDSYFDMVRVGQFSYGAPNGPEPIGLALSPVMTVKARITQIRDLPAGRSVGYGGTYTLQRPSRLGVLPIGYADGYRRVLSNRAEVLLHGRRAPIRGRVSMDQMLIDLTDLPEVALGDEAVLLGRQGSEEIPAWELADRAGTIIDEIVTGWHVRLPRVYR